MSDSKKRLAEIMARRGHTTVPAGGGAGGRAPTDGPDRSMRAARPGRTVAHQGMPDLGGEGFRAENGTPVVLREGDCRVVLREAPEAWADAIIADPGVGSTADVDGWRSGVPGPEYWSAILRAAKPGAHMAVFAGRRTLHRVACFAEDSGWELRDTLMWVYPKGMPMSLDIGQAVDRKMGGTGEAWFRTLGSMTDQERIEWISTHQHNPWYGWGTELRPSWEPILLMRRPIEASSIAENCIRYGVGAINIEATRIDSGERDAIATHIPEGQGDAHGLGLQKDQAVVGTTTLGRWPADALFSHDYNCAENCVEGCPVGMLDTHDGRTPPSRFHYCPKSSRREKDLGGAKGSNPHKSVKPVEITDWLLRLILPPGGLVLDPFCGTGSTSLSAVRLDAGGTVGIDTRGEWLQVARRRIEAVGDLD